jgi:hypothetical protein
MTAKSTEPTGRRDEGSILIMAIVLVVIFGMLVGAIATYAGVSFRHTGIVRSQTEMRASAEAGLRVTIDQLERRQTLCSDFSTVPPPLAIAPNQAEIVVRCTNIGGANQAANSWALILTGVGASASLPSMISAGAASELWTRDIGGRIYMGAPNSHDVANLKLQGDLWFYDGTTNCESPSAPVIPGMTIEPQPPHGLICTPVPWTALVSPFLLPPVPTLVDPAGIDGLVDGKTCRIFRPGTYTEPPDLAAGENYSVSGDYYFEFDEQFQIDNASVLAGRPDAALGDHLYLSMPECDGAWNDADVAGLEDGTGATFFLGREAWINVAHNGRFEILRRLTGTQALSIVAVPTTGNGYEASTRLLSQDEAILSTKEGNNKDAVVHGLVYAPLAQLELGNVANDAAAQITGGAVVAGIDLQASNAENLAISNSSIPSQTKILMTSTATDGQDRSVTVQAVLDYQPSRLVLDGVLNGDTVSSAEADFGPEDVGSTITGTGIPPSVTILNVIDEANAQLSAPAVNGSNVALVIETPQIAINSWRKV